MSPEKEPTFEELVRSFDMDFSSARERSLEGMEPFHLIDYPFAQDIIIETADGTFDFQIIPWKRATEDRYSTQILCRGNPKTPLPGLDEDGLFIFQGSVSLDLDADDAALAGKIYQDHHFSYRPVFTRQFEVGASHVRSFSGVQKMLVYAEEPIVGPVIEGLSIMDASNKKSIKRF